MIDLSITKDPAWIAQQEKRWKLIREDLATDYRKKELNVREQYYMTGTLSDGHVLSDRSLFHLFPIKNHEGWSHVLQNMVKDASLFKDEFYLTFSNLSWAGYSLEEELSRWDYFAGDIFNPVVTSKVPVGKKKEVVSFTVDRRKLVSLIGGAGISAWLDGLVEQKNPKWVVKSDYYFSLISSLDDDFMVDEDGVPVTSSGRIVRRLMVSIFDFNPEVELSTEDRVSRTKFLGEAHDFFNQLAMGDNMKNVWVSVKENYKA